MDRSPLCVVFLTCWIICHAKDPVPEVIEEHGKTTLQYDANGVNISRDKFWYKGSYNTSYLPTAANLVYELPAGLKPTPGPAGRVGDMSISGDNLIINKVQLVDDGYFTCKTEDTSSGAIVDVYKRAAHLRVYKTPELTLTGLDDASYNESDTVNVSCTLTGSYPDVDLTKFIIVWDDHNFDKPENTTGSKEKYYSYRIQKEFNLTRDDNNRTVTCSVEVKRGPGVAAQSKTLNVNSYPAPPPSFTGLSPGEIAGIVIGSVVGAVVISAAVYFAICKCKKKP